MKITAIQRKLKKIHDLRAEYSSLQSLIRATEDLAKRPNYDMDTSYIPNYRKRMREIEEVLNTIFKSEIDENGKTLNY